jgi:hypothetical protein
MVALVNGEIQMTTFCLEGLEIGSVYGILISLFCKRLRCGESTFCSFFGANGKCSLFGCDVKL